MCEKLILAILVVMVLMIITAYMMGWLTKPQKVTIGKVKILAICPGCKSANCKCASMQKITAMPADSFCYQCDGAPFELMPKWGAPCRALPGGTCGNYMPDQMRGPETTEYLDGSARFGDNQNLEFLDGSARFGDNQNLEFMCGSCALPNCYYEHYAGPKDRAKFYYLTGTPDTMLFNNV